MRTQLLIYVVISALSLCIRAQTRGRYNPFRTTLRPLIGDGRYRSSNDGRYKPSNDGRYRPINDGRYRPSPAERYRGDNDGRYRGGNDGKYRAGDEGKYIHKDVGGGKYEGNDGGKYSGSSESYSGGGGQYNGDNSGRYSGTGGQYSGDNSGRYNGGSAINLLQTQNLKPAIQGKGSGKGGSGWRIIRDINSIEEDGYHYLYETENGILAEESGKIENKGSESEGLRSQGFFEYTGDDGLLYRVDYVADNDGFIPKGDHIPKTPPTIQKLVAYLATKPPDTIKN